MKRVEYFTFITAVHLFRCLPPRLVLWKLRVLFYIVGVIFGLRKKVIVSQLRLCFPDKTDKEISTLTKQIYAELAVTAAEVFIFDDEYLQQRLQVIGLDNVRTALSHQRGLIVVSGHFGNWELGAKSLAKGNNKLGAESVPVYGIVKRLSNQYFNAYIDKTRKQAGITTIDMKNALKHIVSALKRNEIVALLIDQYAGGRGVEMSFLGQPTQVYISVAQLALKYHTPVIMAFDVRDERGYHTLTFHPPMSWDNVEYSDENVLQVTQQINNHLEEHIMMYPQLWFWMHRKFRANVNNE